MMDTSLRSLFPLQHRHVWALYKECQDNIWSAGLIDLSEEAAYFSSSIDSDAEMMKLLTATAVKDNILFRTISLDLLNDFQDLEHQSFIGCQITSDQNQFEFYCRLLQKFASNDNDKDFKFYLAENSESYKLKKDWLSSNIKMRPDRVVGYACLKGIIGSVNILAALLYQSNDKMRGLSIGNHWVRRDMAVHLEFCGHMYESLDGEQRLDEQQVKQIVQTVVDFEIKLASETPICSIFKLESSSVESFVKWHADQVLVTLGCMLLYNAQLPPALRSKLEIHIGITRVRRNPLLEDV